MLQLIRYLLSPVIFENKTHVTQTLSRRDIDMQLKSEEQQFNTKYLS